LYLKSSNSQRAELHRQLCDRLSAITPGPDKAAWR